MRVLSGEESIDLGHSASLVRLSSVVAVVDVQGLGVGRRQLHGGHEPGRDIAELAALNGVVGRLAAQDDVDSLCLERVGRVLDVRIEGQDRLGHAVVGRLAGFRASAGAVGASVVGARVGGPAVVVAQLDDHKVAGLDEVVELGEAAFARVGAGGAAGDGAVHDGQREGVA